MGRQATSLQGLLWEALTETLANWDNSKRLRSGFWAYASAYQSRCLRYLTSNGPNPQDGRDIRMLKGARCRHALV